MEERSVNSQSSTVLIIGAGPTGLMAAVELSRLQIPVRIIEKDTSLLDDFKTSRAIGVQARTLELFEQRGLVEPMLQKGNKCVATSVYREGKRVSRLEFTHNGSDYAHVLFVPQTKTEALLRAQLEKQGVTVEREVEFVALAQSDHCDFVKSILKQRDGSLEEFNCAYLISAEGAHSICRTTLDQQFKGNTRDEDYVTGDVFVSGDLAETDLHIFHSEHGFLGLIPMGGGLFRHVASNPLSARIKGGSPSLEELQTLCDQRSHIPVKLHDMCWSSWFRIDTRMVDNLRVGRVFLGGDSGHVHSPVGAQGMNTGIQDMINLAWKLAFVLKGQADPKLLDTYTDDRIPVIREVLKNTQGMTDSYNNKSSFFRKAFSVIGPWILSFEFVQANLSARGSQILLNYRVSPFSVSHGRCAAREVKAGDRVPNVKVMIAGGECENTQEPKSESLFHVLNPNRFTLLFANLTDAEGTLRSVQSSLATWKPLFETYNVASAPGQEQRFQSIFGSQPSLILVRPDGYVAFAGTEDSLEALAKYLSDWFPAQKQTKLESEHAS